MTPMINFIAKHFDGIAQAWDPEATGITSGHGLLHALAQAQVFLVDEAEFDTTTARDDFPGHFENGLTVSMPAPITWIEYKSYRAPGMRHEGRSAFFAFKIDDWVRVIGVSLTGAEKVFVATHFFDVPPELFDTPGPTTGREYRLGTNHGELPQLAGAANFFLELLSFLRLPEASVQARAPLPATQRRFLSEIGPRGRLSPFHAVTYQRREVAHG